MNFFIRQGASDPILKLRLINDAKNDLSGLNDLLENSNITFEMWDVETEMYSILNSSCELVLRDKKYNQTTDEYYITHRFTEAQTAKKGRFEGKVTIQFLDTDLAPTYKLIMPIREKLYINII